MITGTIGILGGLYLLVGLTIIIVLKSVGV